MTKQRVQRRRTAAAPAPNADASRIDVRKLRDRTRGRSLIARVNDTHLAINDLAPRAPTRRRRAAVINTHHDVTLLGQHRMPHPIAAAPTIQNRLSPRLAVNMKQHRILFLAVETGRLDHPAVELHAIADVNFEKLSRGWPQF